MIIMTHVKDSTKGKQSKEIIKPLAKFNDGKQDCVSISKIQYLKLKEILSLIDYVDIAQFEIRAHYDKEAIKTISSFIKDVRQIIKEINKND